MRLLDDYFPSLKIDRYRRFTIGSSISIMGTWIQSTSQAWFVYKMTGSATKLTIVVALQSLSLLFISPFAGSIIDKFNKKTVLLITQYIAMILALILSFLAFTNRIAYWHFPVCAVLLGLVNTFATPTSQVFVYEILPKDSMLNGIALNTTMFHVSRTLGMMLAGILMVSFGPSIGFFVNALSFIPMIIIISFIKPQYNYDKNIANQNIIKDIAQGYQYMFKNGIIFKTFLGLAIVTFFGMNMVNMMPNFAHDIMKADAKGYSYLLTSIGIGSFLGSFLLTIFSKKINKDYLLITNALLFGVILVSLSLSNSFWLAWILLAIGGIVTTTFFSSSNALIQENCDADKRGKITSVYSQVFYGIPMIGILIIGILTDHFGIRFTIMMGSIFVISAILLLNMHNIWSKNKQVVPVQS